MSKKSLSVLLASGSALILLAGCNASVTDDGAGYDESDTDDVLMDEGTGMDATLGTDSSEDGVLDDASSSNGLMLESPSSDNAGAGAGAGYDETQPNT